MRKCKAVILDGGKKVPVEGMFHQWAHQYEEFEDGPGNYTVALIELDDGRIMEAAPDTVVFLDAERREAVYGTMHGTENRRFTGDNVTRNQSTYHSELSYALHPGDAKGTEKVMDEQTIFKKAITTWGAGSQIMMVCEEMAELQKELCKNLRGSGNEMAIAEEIADVEIMLDQMKILFSIHRNVGVCRAQKIDRLAGRLEEVAHVKEHTASEG